MRWLTLENVVLTVGAILAGFVVWAYLSLPNAQAALQVSPIVTGGTGTSTNGGYGSVLVGGKNGEYEFAATSTFGAGSAPVQSVFGRIGAVTAQNGDYSTSLVTEGTNLYYTLARWATAFAGTTTNALTEGSNNLYFTNARSDSRFITDLAATTSVKSIATLQSLSLPYTQLTGAPTALSQFTNDLGYMLTSAFNGLFDNRLSATTSLPNITSLSSLSLPYAQVTGKPTTLSSFTNDVGFVTSSFSTTSAAYFSSVGLAFSTTSANYWLTQQPVSPSFSSTSAAYFASVGLSFSTTSANFNFVNNLAATTSVKSIATLPSLSLPYSQLTGTPTILPFDFPGGATSSLVTFSGGLTASNNVTLSGITGSTQCLHVSSTGVVSGTGSDCGTGSGGVTGIATLAPLITSGPTGSVTLSTSFSTSTFNAFSAQNTFTGVFATLASTTNATTTGSQYFTALNAGELALDANHKLYSGPTSTLSTISGSLALSQLAAQPANTVVANGTGGSAVATAVSTTSLFAAIPGQILGFLGGVWSGIATTTFSSPLIFSNGNVTCQTATGSVPGCLAAADFTTFNAKQAAGNYITALTGDVTASGPGSVPATIAANHVTLPDIAQIGAGTLLANNTSATGNVTAVSTSTLFGVAPPGYDLVNTATGLALVPTTTYSGGAGISAVFANNNVAITNLIGYPFPSNATGTALTFSGGASIANNLTLSGITGSTQCLHVNTSGVISGTGSDCGSAGGSITAVTASYPLASSGGTTPNITTAFGTTTNTGIGSNLFIYTNANGVFVGAASSSLNLPNSALQNSSITLNGAAVSLGGSGTISSTTLLANTNTYSGGNSFLSAANFTLRDPTDQTKKAQFDLSGISTGNTNTYTLKDISAGTIPLLETSQTWTGLTNTFTHAPAFNTALGVPSGGTGSTTLTGILKGALTGTVATAIGDTDYQKPISLTTTGSSGAATFIADVLNIPQYSGGGSSFPFTPQSWGNSTTSVLGMPGFIVTGSSTLSSLGTGGLAVNNGLIYNAATTTFSGGLTYANGNVTNAGVTSNVAGNGIAISNSTGASTITNTIGYEFPGNATGTAISFGAGLISNSSTTFSSNINFTAISNGALGVSGHNLYSTATTTASCSGSASCTPFTVFGSSPVTINDSGGGGGAAYPFTPLINYGIAASATSTNIWAQNGITASSTNNHFAQLSIDTQTNSPTAFVINNQAGQAAFTVDDTQSQGGLAIGTSSPFARIALHANNGDTGTILLAIGSSTQSATTTLFSISNTGQIITNYATGLLHSVAGVISSSLISLTADVTGILPIANGGTNASALGPGLKSNGTTLSQIENRSFAVLATSTTGIITGTTTVNIESGYGEVWNYVQCYTVPNGATANVDFYFHNNAAASHLNYIAASSTAGRMVMNTNNTITANASTSVDIGTPAGNPTQVTCTVNDTI